jgi:hypothetical protein
MLFVVSVWAVIWLNIWRIEVRSKVQLNIYLKAILSFRESNYGKSPIEKQLDKKESSSRHATEKQKHGACLPQKSFLSLLQWRHIFVYFSTGGTISTYTMHYLFPEQRNPRWCSSFQTPCSCLKEYLSGLQLSSRDISIQINVQNSPLYPLVTGSSKG